MRFDIVTIFPEFFDGPLDYGILRRARATGLVEVHMEDLRDYTHDRHRTVDDRPFGGGEGMVLKPEPLFEAVETILGVAPVSSLSKKPAAVSTSANTSVVLLSAAGKMFTEQVARRLSKLERVVLICGRYEGVDERVAEHLATEEISIGDFVLSGGELPAAVIVDAVTRLLPGALGNEASSVRESFSAENTDAAAESDGDGGKSGASSSTTTSKKRKEKIVGAEFSAWLSSLGARANANGDAERGGILDCPHYTRPAAFRDWAIPEILNGGNHEEIRRWRRRAALAKTLRNRPELLARAGLTNEELLWLEELHASAGESASKRAGK
jgi:tRNA (guanine37-N1)-methyltransferase